MTKQEREFAMIYHNARDSLSSGEKLVYSVILLLSSRYESNRRITLVSIEGINMLVGNYNNSRNKKEIRESIDTLCEKGIVTVYTSLLMNEEVDVIKNNQSIIIEVLNPFSGRFTKVYNDDMKKLLSIDGVSKHKLFSVYLEIISDIFESVSSGRYTVKNIDEIADVTKIDRKTVMSHITDLENAKLIIKIEKRIGSRVSNAYCRYEDYDHAIQMMGII